jgi:hypothetical protein
MSVDRAELQLGRPWDEVYTEIKEKLGIGEEAQKKIASVREKLIAANGPSEGVVLISSGHGFADLICFGPYTNLFPWDWRFRFSFKITAPSSGRWRAVISNSGKTIFDRSEINQGYACEFEICLPKGESADLHCSIELLWSEKRDALLEYQIQGEF